MGATYRIMGATLRINSMLLGGILMGATFTIAPIHGCHVSHCCHGLQDSHCCIVVALLYRHLSC
jgi:hypothetical protein